MVSSPERRRLRREASAARAQEISMRFSCSCSCCSGWLWLLPSAGPSNKGTTFWRLAEERHRERKDKEERLGSMRDEDGRGVQKERPGVSP